jgi:multidrug efflux pump subunit AcrA (membrane-fusion protein)
VGYEVEVVLDAMPDKIFRGRVVQVDPQLLTESGMQVIRGLVELDADSFAKPQGLLMGLNATVDVIGGRAEGALLVPVEALRELSPSEYAVFVMEDGDLELRMVQVGLMDFTYAEIRSGLSLGDVVSTGIVETR